MKALVQRVSRAEVRVGGEVVGAIQAGLLVLVGVEHADGPVQAARLAAKLVRLRIFPNDLGKMDHDLRTTGGGLLVVSQFTLCAELAGNRPSFTAAATPDHARPLVDQVIAEAAQALDRPVASGRFGADMAVELVNDGPVTLWLAIH